MRRSKEVQGLPLISLENGQQVGKVRGLVVDPEQVCLAALIVDQKSWLKDSRLVPMEAVKSIGDDAVTITSAAVVTKASADADLARLIKNPAPVVGARVVTEDGRILGTVEEFLFEPQGGKITALEIGGKFMEGLLRGRASLATGGIKTIGRDAVVVTAQAVEDLVRADSSLQERLKVVKDSGARVWDTTVDSTKKLSGGLTRSFDKLEGGINAAWRRARHGAPEGEAPAGEQEAEDREEGKQPPA